MAVQDVGHHGLHYQQQQPRQQGQQQQQQYHQQLQQTQCHRSEPQQRQRLQLQQQQQHRSKRRVVRVDRIDIAPADGVTWTNSIALPSIVDVSFVSTSIACPDAWAVASDTSMRFYSVSDHRYILFTDGPPTSQQQGDHRQQQQRGRQQRHESSLHHAGRRWKSTQFTTEAFRVALKAAGFPQRAVRHEGMVDAVLETDRVELDRIVSDLFPTHQPADWPEVLVASGEG
ncbi:myb-like protein AA [Anopheles funestus]|uniref:myb-like protein AA n=1 Tax=Anopheles funestus TaxID=62324 RepID=UPI0020C688E0|nr:myb-like protein AA [Anopheles funestus]